jgi:membrane associated rhomboid family serine protease
MFPIRDDVPSRTFPAATVALIIVNALVFFVEVSQGSRGLQVVAQSYGFVPAYFTAYIQGAEVPAGRLFFTWVSSMFLHGGWLHLIGNMWFLWIFGDNVEDRLGHARFLLFFILCGMIGNAAHYVFNAGSMLPAIGASGAISGVLGVYLVSYPRARILVLVPIFFLYLIEVPAIMFVGFWFVLQFISGAVSVAARGASGGVAWWAHVGGFVGGILIFKLFRPRPRVWQR